MFPVLILLFAIHGCTLFKKKQNSMSELKVSQLKQQSSSIKLFKKIVGRDPSPVELSGYKNLSYENKVENILSSEAFFNEGFFNFQQDRLLLHREGSENWVRNSQANYCALKLEAKNVAQLERTDANGFFSTTSYRTKYIPILGTLLKNYLGNFEVSAIVNQLPDPKPQGLWLLRIPEVRSVIEKQLSNSLLTNTEVLAGKKVSILFSEEPFLYEEVLGQSSCQISTLKGLSANSLPSDENYTAFNYYIKVEVPQALQGIHGSSYYLGRHKTSQKNQNLSRARNVFFSYLCSEISPNNAEKIGDTVSVEPALSGYFSSTDTHTLGAKNCYDCHARVQPIANFFGKLTPKVDFDNITTLPQSLFARQDEAFERPGGYWRGADFFPLNGNNLGLEGLHNLVSQMPEVKECLVRTAWSYLVGPSYPLPATMQESALASFQKTGAPRLHSLITHLAVENKLGRAYFEESESVFAEQLQNIVDADTCSKATKLSLEQEANVPSLLADNCKACHNSGKNNFFTDKNEWQPELSIVNLSSDKNIQKEQLGEAWQKAYCSVKLQKMPMGGNFSSSQNNNPLQLSPAQKRDQVTCYLAIKRNMLAKTEKISSKFFGMDCNQKETIFNLSNNKYFEKGIHEIKNEHF